MLAFPHICNLSPIRGPTAEAYKNYQEKAQVKFHLTL